MKEYIKTLIPNIFTALYGSNEFTDGDNTDTYSNIYCVEVEGIVESLIYHLNLMYRLSITDTPYIMEPSSLVDIILFLENNHIGNDHLVTDNFNYKMVYDICTDIISQYIKSQPQFQYHKQ